MRDVAIISFAQSDHSRAVTNANEVEMLMPVTAAAIERAGMTKNDIGFTVSGSTDYLAGTAFSFVQTLDGVGPWPPIQESHVEMDGAWALYEAWVKLQLGEIDTALIYSYGKSSPGPTHEVLSRQLDPYFVAPLWPDAISLAALQARTLLESGKATEKDFADVVARSRKSALDNPHAQLKWDKSADEVLAEPMIVDPLRKDDCPPITDGVAAVVIAADDVARAHCSRPAWIRGIDHRIESAVLGLRELSDSPSTRAAGHKAGAGTGSFDVAELHAPFSHQEVIVRDALGLGGDVDINPSGGALCANPIMAAGLIRFGEAAARIIDGRASRAIAHATSGACLQQNLVAILEGG
ncbi:MAG TPA: thiolase domain-containing protein [Acidimicrobiales bacterium]|jgi:acetyl-CoA acetyltransferase|nr:thiolase domain-containing protein [Acidimicrobiales bacterium]